MTEPLLKVSNLSKHYPITEGVFNSEIGRVRAVDGISFEVDDAEDFALVDLEADAVDGPDPTDFGVEYALRNRVVFREIRYLQ